MTIELKLDGELVMRSCSRCDRRFWQADGEAVDLTGILGREPMRQPALR